MKLNLKKQVVKNLSRDDKKLPLDMTPKIAGGNVGDSQMNYCEPEPKTIDHSQLC